MGANPLEYLDFGGALKSGFQLGLQVQEMRTRANLEKVALANQGIRLEIDRKQEERQRQELQALLEARRAMEMQRAKRQADAAGYATSMFDLVNQGIPPLEANKLSILKYPDAPQADNSVIDLIPKSPREPKVTRLPEGGMLIEEGFKYVPDPQPKVQQSTEFEFNEQGVPFFRNSKGELEIPPDSGKIREEHLRKKRQVEQQQKKLSTLKSQQDKGVKKVETTFGIGGRKIQDAIDEAQASLDELMSQPKSQPKSNAKAQGKSTPAPVNGAQTNSPAPMQFKVGQRARQNGKVFVFDGATWNPE